MEYSRLKVAIYLNKININNHHLTYLLQIRFVSFLLIKKGQHFAPLMMQ